MQPSIYPNPASSSKVNFGRFEESFQVFNSIGVMILSGKDSDGFEIEGLDKGINLVKTGSKVEKLIIE